MVHAIALQPYQWTLSVLPNPPSAAGNSPTANATNAVSVRVLDVVVAMLVYCLSTASVLLVYC